MLDAGAVGLQLLACQRGATELATRGRLATDLVELGAHVSPNGYLDRLRALVDSTDPRRQLAVVHSWINVPLEQP